MDMNLIRSLTTLAGLSCAMGGALAHGPGLPRYQVSEIHAPPSVRAGCLPELAQSTLGASINDFGIVSANFTCYTQYDPAGPFPSSTTDYSTFVGAPWLSSFELPSSAGSTYTNSYQINNLGQVFGGDNSPTSQVGAKWSLSGGLEHVFDAPSCEGLNINGATSGNSRYVVGWGLRVAPELGSPYDTMCLTGYWLIRQPGGEVTLGPRNGSAYDINAFDVAVGTSDNSAIRMHVPSGNSLVLHAGIDGVHGAAPIDINDLGQVAGHAYDYTTGTFTCARYSALRWDRLGNETSLPNLPGAVSSRASAIGYDGEVVGESGPGDYCPHINNQNERAALWLGSRVIDLNMTIPVSLRVTLSYASSVNRRGQILATGYSNDEPVSQCPDIRYDSAGQLVVQMLACRNMRVFVLTPRR
jgi:uncharacterized membrane protein